MITRKMRVRVLATKLDGTPHPHAGKTGTVIEVMGLYLGSPRAQVKIDEGFDQAGNIMIVSLACLELIDGADNDEHL